MLHAAKREFCDCEDDFNSLHRLLNALRYVGTEWYYEPPPEIEDCIMPLCDAVANCIDANPATRTALRDWFIDEASTLPLPGGGDAPFDTINQQIPPDEWEKNIAPDICTDDILYGQIRNAVIEMNEANIDALQIFVAEGNLRENVANIIEAVPIVGEFSLDDIIEYTALVVDFIKENYDAAYTGTLEDEIVCDLFCLARTTCNVSMELLYEYFKGKVLPVAPDVQQIVSLATLVFVLGNVTAAGFPPVGRIVVDLMMFAQLGLIRYANLAIGGMTFGRLTNLFKIGAGFPDDDWAVLCTNCNNPEINDVWRFNFREFNQFSTQSNWAYSDGHNHGDYTDSSQRRRVLLGLGTLNPAHQIVSLTVNRSYQRGQYDANVTAEELTVSGTVIEPTQFSAMPLSLSSADRTYVLNNSAVTSVTYNLQASRQPLASGALSGNATVHHIDIEFGGKRPQWAVGKGYPIDVFCPTWVFQTSEYALDWVNISDGTNHPSGEFGVWVSNQGLQPSVTTLANVYNQFANNGSWVLKSSVPFRFYGFNLVYSSSPGVAGAGTLNNVWSISASLAGSQVYTTGLQTVTTQTNARLVRYTDVLIDTLYLNAVCGNHPTRATTLANPGSFTFHNLLIRAKGSPTFNYEIGC